MSTRGFLLIDVNNLGFAAQSKKKLTVGDMEVQAIFGVIRSIRALSAQFSHLKPIVLHDGKSWRYQVYPEYKANRDEIKYEADKQKVANREAYRKQKPFIKRALEAMGVAQVFAINMEADDLAAILVRKYQPAGKKIVLISGDEDWLQLVQPGVGWYDPVRNKRVTMKNFKEATGVENGKLFVQKKALVGDKGDNIIGVDKIGPAGAVQLIEEYGSVPDFLNRSMDGTLPKKMPKKFADFATEPSKQDAYMNALTLVDLNSHNVPSPVGMRITNGAPDEAAFIELCKEFSFKSILNQMPGYLEPFQQVAA